MVTGGAGVSVIARIRVVDRGVTGAGCRIATVIGADIVIIAGRGVCGITGASTRVIHTLPEGFIAGIDAAGQAVITVAGCVDGAAPPGAGISHRTEESVIARIRVVGVDTLAG